MQHKDKSFRRNSLIFICTIVVTTGLSLLFEELKIENESILMIYMIGVLIITALTNGYYYGIVASLVSVMTFNYFFMEPYRTFEISSKDDVILIIVFLAASLISANLTDRFQKQLLLAKKSERIAKILFEMSESFINVTGKENIIKQGIRYIREYTGYESDVEKYVEGEFKLVENHKILVIPIIGITNRIGTLKVYHHDKKVTEEQLLLIKTTANQIGIALDRELIYTEQETIKLAMEREHMRSNMLRSISHDLRTPLTGIIGDCGYILEAVEADKEVKELTNDIKEQAEWLVKMVENILSMTKIESGKLSIKKQNEVVDDIIYEAVSHIQGIKVNRQLIINLPEKIIEVMMDAKLIVQVFINLLDNAMKYSKEGDQIIISVSEETEDEKVFFTIENTGEGIDNSILSTLFEEFVTSCNANPDRQKGIGLGLAICKGVVEAHGGSITAENRVEGGAKIMFWLPMNIVK